MIEQKLLDLQNQNVASAREGEDEKKVDKSDKGKVDII